MTGYNRLPLAGIHNARDLGGWSAGPGRVTRRGVFLRSARPKTLSEREAAFLRAYGLRTVLDLRNPEETALRPSALAGLDGVQYEIVPVFDPAGGETFTPPPPGTGWGEMSADMLAAHPDWVRAVFAHLARAEGCTLFHCATGKDRTGMIAALLLRICGVCREDAAADYCVSQLYLAEEYAEQAAERGGRMPPFADTPGSNLLQLLDCIAARWGSEEALLHACGVRPEELGAIRAKFVEEADQ